MRQCPSKKDAHGAETQQCKSILETIMIQLDNDGKLNTILYALCMWRTHIKKSTCNIICPDNLIQSSLSKSSTEI